MFPILQTKTADTAHMVILKVTPGPSPTFGWGLGTRPLSAGSVNTVVA